MQHEEKQRRRSQDGNILNRMWDPFDLPRNKAQCLDLVPECEFWLHIEAQLLFKKCCAEHLRLREVLFYVFDAFEAAKMPQEEDSFGMPFLMFGTLLSAVRDGTLVPWETDIDLGLADSNPAPVVEAFRTIPSHFSDWQQKDLKHLFRRCNLKVSASPKRSGHCSDIHSIYFASGESGLIGDTSRAEIWPYYIANSAITVDNNMQKNQKQNRSLFASNRSEKTLFPVRAKEFALPAEMILPLRQSWPSASPSDKVFECRLWGRLFWCPQQPKEFLTLEYHGVEQWRRPKTIHWGAGNVAPWLTR